MQKQKSFTTFVKKLKQSNLIINFKIFIMDVLLKSAIAQQRFSSLLNEISGYKTITTFYSDFTIADHFGIDSIKDTYKRAMDSWKCDYKYITELYMVLNHKIWEHYENGNEEFARLYDELWRECGCWCDDNLTADEIDYFYTVID